MSMLPPKMACLNLTNYNKLMTRLDGRDKILRFVQYFARFIVFKMDDKKDPTSKKLTEFYKAVGLHRKAFKLGVFLEEFEKFTEALNDTKLSQTEKNITLILRASMVVFAVLDNLLWFISVKVVESFDKEFLKLRSNQFRLVAAIANTMLNLFSIASNQKKIEKSLSASSDKAETDKLREKQTLNVLKFTKNSCDILTYSTSANLINLDDGYIGFLGAASAVFSLIDIWSNKI